MKPVIWRITHLVILLGLLLFPFSTKAWALSISLDDAVDNSLTWTTGGDAEWFGQTSVYYFDTDAAQSGDMPGGTLTELMEQSTSMILAVQIICLSVTTALISREYLPVRFIYHLLSINRYCA